MTAVRDEGALEGTTLESALAELARHLVDAEPLEALLQRVASLAVAAVPGCDHAGVTLLDGAEPVTAACTDAVVQRVDQQQYDLGDGPCLDAARRRVVHRVDERDAEQRWPAFVEHARRHGVRSFLAAPLVAGGRGVGALNLYARSPDGFDGVDDALALLFAGQAAVALANARLYRHAVDVNGQLAEAMASRAVIEQAKGVLIGTAGLTPDAAFLELRDRSQRGNRKLRDVAVDVVADAVARTTV